MLENVWTWIVVLGFLPVYFSWEKPAADGPMTLGIVAQTWSLVIVRHNGRTVAWRLKVPAWDWLVKVLASWL